MLKNLQIWINPAKKSHFSVSHHFVSAILPPSILPTEVFAKNPPVYLPLYPLRSKTMAIPAIILQKCSIFISWASIYSNLNDTKLNPYNQVWIYQNTLLIRKTLFFYLSICFVRRMFSPCTVRRKSRATNSLIKMTRGNKLIFMRIFLSHTKLPTSGTDNQFLSQYWLMYWVPV